MGLPTYQPFFVFEVLPFVVIVIAFIFRFILIIVILRGLFVFIIIIIILRNNIRKRSRKY
jgi:hypothetical protein